MKPTIAIVEQSGLVEHDELVAACAALQKQVSQEFAPAWNTDANLVVYGGNEKVPPEYWQLILLKDSDQAGALGYHELTASGQPLGKVFAKADLDAGNSWTVTLSHELLEMLGDPYINTCALNYSPDGKASFFAYEACDACEDDQFGYKIDGVLVSDFVTPAWFVPGSAGPFDRQLRIGNSFQLLPGGYIGLYTDGGWKQITGQLSIPGPEGPEGSRRARRNIPSAHWRRSAW